MLYLLIVVPKEFWGLSNDHPIYDQIEKAWSLNDVNVITDKSPWQKPIYKFIHHLRNAIVHANFEFMDENFVFWDHYNKDKPETYRAVLSKSAMQRFLEVVGALLSNIKEELLLSHPLVGRPSI